MVAGAAAIALFGADTTPGPFHERSWRLGKSPKIDDADLAQHPRRKTPLSGELLWPAAGEGAAPISAERAGDQHKAETEDAIRRVAEKHDAAEEKLQRSEDHSATRLESARPIFGGYPERERFIGELNRLLSEEESVHRGAIVAIRYWFEHSDCGWDDVIILPPEARRPER